MAGVIANDAGYYLLRFTPSNTIRIKQVSGQDYGVNSDMRVFMRDPVACSPASITGSVKMRVLCAPPYCAVKESCKISPARAWNALCFPGFVALALTVVSSLGPLRPESPENGGGCHGGGCRIVCTAPP